MIKYLFFLILLLSPPLHTHEIKPAIVDITIIEENASIEFKLNAETVLSEIDASIYVDTNNSPQSQKYDEFRAFSVQEIEKLVLKNKLKFINKIQINNESEIIPLLLQVTMFTLAHSITLILASFNLILIPAVIVEPLIALSISYVAIENIFQRRLVVPRYVIIFIFGLIHGLGFAFVLGDIGLNTSQLVISLISFNLGVEVAQIAIIILASIIFILPSRQSWYRAFLQIPISVMISLIGLYWFIERVFF